MIQCSNCKTENNDGTMFCDECGEQLDQNNNGIELSNSSSDEQTGDENSLITDDDTIQTPENLSEEDEDTRPVIQTMYLPGGKEVEIREGDIHIISRTEGGHPKATVKIDDGGISSAGIKVEGRGGQVFVTDLGGGHVIVGNIVSTNTEAEVHEHGVIYTGETSIFFG